MIFFQAIHDYWARSAVVKVIVSVRRYFFIFQFKQAFATLVLT